MNLCLLTVLHLLASPTASELQTRPCFGRQAIMLMAIQHKNDSSGEGSKEWKVVNELVKIQSPWLTIIGERIQDDRDKLLDYWRVEKDDSAVIVTIHRGQFIFPKPIYRVGVDETTLDFPGGRVPGDGSAVEVVPKILERELGIEDSAIYRIASLNSKGWPINSSFSNQKLFGFVAEIKDDVDLDPSFLHTSSYSIIDTDEIGQLLEELTCLQCRAVLLEWLAQRR